MASNITCWERMTLRRLGYRSILEKRLHLPMTFISNVRTRGNYEWIRHAAERVHAGRSRSASDGRCSKSESTTLRVRAWGFRSGARLYGVRVRHAAESVDARRNVAEADVHAEHVLGDLAEGIIGFTSE